MYRSVSRLNTALICRRQPGRGEAVRAAFVLLDLLKRDGEAFAQRRLRHTLEQSRCAQPGANDPIQLVFFVHDASAVSLVTEQRGTGVPRG